jgi:hypothetical protein
MNVYRVFNLYLVYKIHYLRLSTLTVRVFELHAMLKTVDRFQFRFLSSMLVSPFCLSYYRRFCETASIRQEEHAWQWIWFNMASRILAVSSYFASAGTPVNGLALTKSLTAVIRCFEVNLEGCLIKHSSRRHMILVLQIFADLPNGPKWERFCKSIRQCATSVRSNFQAYRLSYFQWRWSALAWMIQTYYCIGGPGVIWSQVWNRFHASGAGIAGAFRIQPLHESFHSSKKIGQKFNSIVRHFLFFFSGMWQGS